MKLLAVSQQPILIRGLDSVVAAAGWDMIAFTGPTTDILDVVRSEEAHVVLIDFNAAEHFGVVLDIREHVPRCPIVLLARDISPELAYQSLKAGVRGILRASAAADGLLNCLAAVGTGNSWCEDDLKTAFFNTKTAMLSPRESQLIVLVSEGLKNKEIGAALAISESTVRIYLSALFQRLGVKDRYELAIYGLRTFLQDPRVPTIGMDPALLASTPVRFLMFEKPRPRQRPQPATLLKRSAGR